LILRLSFIFIFSTTCIWAAESSSDVISDQSGLEAHIARGQKSDESTSLTPAHSHSRVQVESTAISRHKRVFVPRAKEAEGTEAPNRFDNDLSIKSEYQLNGQSLEVDTD
jgi:hypothetical protein